VSEPSAFSSTATAVDGQQCIELASAQRLLLDDVVMAVALSGLVAS